MGKAREIVALSEYTQRQRWIETVCLLIFLALTLGLLTKLVWSLSLQNSWVLFAGFLTGIIAADFVSGFVHWAADTWGTSEWPIVGPSLIRSFREHHVDQAAITRHDFVETNGASSMVCIPVTGLAFLIPLNQDNIWAYFATSFILFFSLFILLTNQIHKWSHSRQVPMIVKRLQDWGLILSGPHHRVHHTPPFEHYYCITTGWLNPILTGIRFFRTAEAIITKVTGAQPREDDQRLLSLKRGTTDDTRERTQTDLVQTRTSPL